LSIADAQDPQSGTTRRFVLHTRARETEVMAAITRHLDRLHSTASVRFEVMEQLIGQSLLRERLVAALSMSFGALAPRSVHPRVPGDISLFGSRAVRGIARRADTGRPASPLR
jgi:hypothetical protein